MDKSRRWKLWSVLAVASLTAGLAVPAPAGANHILTRQTVPSHCLDGMPEKPVLAFACDARGHDHIALTLGEMRAASRHGAEMATLTGSEPLLPGEHLLLHWRHPSRDALLAVSILGADGPTMRVLALAWRPEQVEVTALADGGLEVRTPTRTGVLPAPRARQPIVWNPRTPEAAARRVLWAISHVGTSYTALRTICAAMDPVVTAPLAFTDPKQEGCALALTLAMLFGDGPTPVSSSHRQTSVLAQGGRAVMRTRLTHRYRPATHVSVTARALLVRDDAGIWRLGTIDPLWPATALERRAPYSDGELTREYAHDARAGRRRAAAFAKAVEIRRADTVTSAAAAPCSVALHPDPPDDVQVVDDRARRQSEHRDVDVRAAGASEHCVVVRSAEPLPREFALEVYASQRLEIDVKDGEVHMDATPFAEGADTISVHGITAQLRSNELVVTVPFFLMDVSDIVLSTEPHGLAYGDVVSLKRPRANRSCLVPGLSAPARIAPFARLQTAPACG